MHGRGARKIRKRVLTMLIAVTGSTGFLGRYIVRQLARAGHRLRCWHRRHSDRGGLDDVASSIEWLPGELGDSAATQQLVKSTSALVHAAVQWEGPRNRGRGSHGDASVFFGTNLTGSLELFQAALDASVARCVYIS